MPEIIPSINCQPGDLKCVIDSALRFKKFEWLHLDVADGRFTFHKTWNHPEHWKELGFKNKLEVHLMVEDIEEEAKKWIKAGAKRIIVQVEELTPERFESLKKICGRKAELMISATPHTPVEKLYMYSKKCQRFQILSVYPGPYGQNFISGTMDKVKALKKIKKVVVEVDGGIDRVTAHKAVRSGADIMISHSYLMESSDPLKAARELAGK